MCNHHSGKWFVSLDNLEKMTSNELLEIASNKNYRQGTRLIANRLINERKLNEIN